MLYNTFFHTHNFSSHKNSTFLYHCYFLPQQRRSHQKQQVLLLQHRYIYALNSNFLLPGFSSKHHFVRISSLITAGLILCCVKSCSCCATSPRCCTNQLHCTNENPLYQAPYTKALLQNHLTTGNPFSITTEPNPTMPPSTNPTI